MEVIVPRNKTHAMAIKAWNKNIIPNLVNVFAKSNGATGLNNWTDSMSITGWVLCSVNDKQT